MTANEETWPEVTWADMYCSECGSVLHRPEECDTGLSGDD